MLNWSAIWNAAADPVAIVGGIMSILALIIGNRQYKQHAEESRFSRRLNVELLEFQKTHLNQINTAVKEMASTLLK